MLVCVGIPSGDGKVCAATVDALLAEQVRASGQGVHILVLWCLGNSLIGCARNKIAADFLAIPNAECLIFVDADISWETGDLVKLALSDKQVIGATYRAKAAEERFLVMPPVERDGDLCRVNGVPGGFLKISREVFGSLDVHAYSDAAGRVFRDYFPTGMHDGVLYGEDYGFCRLWREYGGMVWLDPSIKLKHHGGFQVFTGDPQEWINGETDEKARAASEGKAGGDRRRGQGRAGSIKAGTGTGAGSAPLSVPSNLVRTGRPEDVQAGRDHPA